MVRLRALLHTSNTPVVLLSWPANVFVMFGVQCSVVLFLPSRAGAHDAFTQSLRHMREREGGGSFPIPHDVPPPALLMQHADVKLRPGPWISDEEFMLQTWFEMIKQDIFIRTGSSAAICFLTLWSIESTKPDMLLSQVLTEGCSWKIYLIVDL